MTVIERDLDSIIPYEDNPRINDPAVPYVANSLKTFGWKQPIVIDKDGVIIAGHTRWKAARSLGMKKAPCVIADDLTPEEVQAYRLADNKVGEIAEWDFAALDEQLAAITELDMTQFGFEELSDEDEAEEEQEEENPTDVLPESRVFVFGVSAFGVKSECFLEVPLEAADAERLIERINTAGADAISAAIVEALHAC